jgi:Sulfotransferase family
VASDVLKPAAIIAPQSRVPDFFIVGHPKCGTTALYEILKSHPQIFLPDLKEPQFFATELRYRAQPEGAPPGLPETLDDYLTLFAGARREQLVGEASTAYLWSHVAASSIADLQPAARIIAILREPVSFLHSLHLQFVQSHLEMERNLRKAIALEGVRRQGQHDRRSPLRSPQVLLYMEHVRYVQQLRRYHELFSSENVLVLIYDDFRRDNEGAVRTVLRFLGIDDSAPIGVTEANPTVRVRSQRINNLVRALYMGDGQIARAIKTGVKALTTRRLRHHALYATQRHIVYGKAQPADESLMVELRRRFKPEVVALSEYLDRDLVTLWGYDRV